MGSTVGAHSRGVTPRSARNCARLEAQAPRRGRHPLDRIHACRFLALLACKSTAPPPAPSGSTSRSTLARARSGPCLAACGDAGRGAFRVSDVRAISAPGRQDSANVAGEDLRGEHRRRDFGALLFSVVFVPLLDTQNAQRLLDRAWRCWARSLRWLPAVAVCDEQDQGSTWAAAP